MDKKEKKMAVPIYGIKVDGKYSLGEFILCSKDYLFSELPENKFKNDLYKKENANTFLLFDVYEDDNDKNLKFVYEKANDFKRLIDFCCGRNDNFPAVNLELFSNVYESAFIFSNSQDYFEMSQSINNKFISVEHNIEMFVHEMNVNKTNYVWNLYSKPNKSDKEQKIINAILWIGKAHVEIDCNIKFIELCFALESLLQFNMGFINPSITYSLASTCAMIIANKYEDRKIVFNNVKNLYQKRSAIAHGNKTTVTDDECTLLYEYLVWLLKYLNEKDIWRNCKTMKEVVDRIEEMRFGRN